MITVVEETDGKALNQGDGPETQGTGNIWTHFGEGNQQEVVGMDYQGIRKEELENGAEISQVSVDG